MGIGGAAGWGGPVAQVTSVARAVRVSPVAPIAGDDPVTVDEAAVRDAVEPSSSGRAIVRGPDGTPRTTWAGNVRSLPSGATRVEAVVDGWRFELDVEDAARAELRRRAGRAGATRSASGPAEIRAMIPGRIVAVRVAVDDVVDSGQVLLVVEAMKMQNELRATRGGTVERVAVGVGQTVDLGDVLVVIR